MKIDRKYIYTGILLICCVFFIVGYVYLYSYKKEQLDSISSKIYSYKKILCKEKSLILQKNNIDKLSTRLKGIFINAKSDSDAAIKFQEAISSLGEGMDLSIDRFEAPRMLKYKDVRFIGMRIYFSGRSESILDFIYRVENSKNPYFIVDEVELRKLPKRRTLPYFRLKGFIFVKAMVKIKGE